MTVKNKRAEISRVVDEMNSIKSRMIRLMSDLEAAGATRQAGSLGTIIAKLETWQQRA